MAVRLSWVDRPLAVCRLPADSATPEWATRPGALFCSVRSGDELSLVCEAPLVPQEIDSEGPFVAMKLEGQLSFALVGVLTSLLVPLADAGISVFVVSTYDTDYVLVKGAQRQQAVTALTGAGHEFV